MPSSYEIVKEAPCSAGQIVFPSNLTYPNILFEL